MQDRCPSHRVSAAALLQQGVLRDGVLEIGLIVQFLHSLTGEYRGKLLAPAAQENQ